MRPGPGSAPAVGSAYTMPERRQYPRHSICAPFPPTFVNFGEPGKAVVVDLSSAGMGLLSARSLHVGHTPQLQFELPENGRMLVKGCVVWSDASGRAGLVLADPLPVTRKTIRQWLGASAPEEAETALAYTGSRIDSLSDWVTGPLLLNLQILQHAVHEKRVGVYMLGYGNGEFHPSRVGRADDLREALIAYIGQYDQFLYAYCASDHDAFQRECRLYHHYRPRNNRSHPTRTPGATWDCPVCHGFK